MNNNKDWSGNSKTTFVSLGASNHSEKEREENDYYATEPKAIELLLEQEEFSNVWECASGGGHLATVLEQRGLLGKATDLIDRGYGQNGINFLEQTQVWNGDIITNPPYKYAQEFMETGLSLLPEGRKIALFLKLQFLEGKARRKFFDKFPPKTIYVSSSRLNCAHGGDFDKYKSSAIAYAWFVWQKGVTTEPVIKWIN